MANIIKERPGTSEGRVESLAGRGPWCPLNQLYLEVKHALYCDPQLSRSQRKKRASRISTAIKRVCEFLHKARTEAKVADILNIYAPFREFLVGQGYGKEVFRCISDWRTLTRYARQLGYCPAEVAILESWRPISERVLGATTGVPAIIEYAISTGRIPADYCQADLEEWAAWKLESGRSEDYVQSAFSRFLKVVRDAGLENLFPRLEVSKGRRFCSGIPVSEMPDHLSGEIELLLASAEQETAKKAGFQMNSVTLSNVKNVFERLYGFVVDVKHEVVDNLACLIGETNIDCYVNWMLDRGFLRSSIVGPLSHVYSILHHHPSYKSLGLEWFHEIFKEIPVDPRSGLQIRRESKSMPYEVLASIPHVMRVELEREPDPLAKGWIAHDALVMRFVNLAWPRRNLVECRIGNSNPNVFLSTAPPRKAPFALTTATSNRIQSDPNELIWMYSFSAQDTDRRKPMFGQISDADVPYLCEYLQHYRPILVNNDDPGTLFLNRRGGALRDWEFGVLVGNLTETYGGGKRIGIETARHIIVADYLQSHPDDIAGAAQILGVSYHAVVKRFDLGLNEKLVGRIQLARSTRS